ncbi:MAG: hypothetical protein M1814_003898 [Vezdaea aestivalis]|nr:MAG: hypothetical protein M1814_003898 [Vezdaea aestivalis]
MHPYDPKQVEIQFQNFDNISRMLGALVKKFDDWEQDGISTMPEERLSRTVNEIKNSTLPMLERIWTLPSPIGPESQWQLDFMKHRGGFVKSFVYYGGEHSRRMGAELTSLMEHLYCERFSSCFREAQNIRHPDPAGKVPINWYLPRVLIMKSTDDENKANLRGFFRVFYYARVRLSNDYLWRTIVRRVREFAEFCSYKEPPGGEEDLDVFRYTNYLIVNTHC